MDQQTINKVYQWIDKNQDQIIKNLMEIASIESVSDETSDVKPFGQGCINVLNAMLDKGNKEGFKTHNYDNYVGSITYDASAKENIGIVAHLDVVPAGEGWHSDPYQPVIKDQFLFGRGVGDNKSAAIAGLFLQMAFRELNIPLKHNIELLLGTNEETGMSDFAYFTKMNYPYPKFSFVPDAGFPGMCGEFGRVRYELKSNRKLSSDFIDLNSGTVFNIIPNKATVVINKNSAIDYQSLPDDFDIEETSQGIQITAHGLSSHAAGPERGINAIRVLTDALIKVKGIKKEDLEILSFINSVNQDPYGTFLGFAKTDEVSGQTVSSGTVLRFNEGYITLLNDCRFCVTDSMDRILKCIEDTSTKYQFSVSTLEKSYPYHLDPNGKIVQTIQKVYQDYSGKENPIIIGKGGTYAGKIPNAVATGIVFNPDNIKPEGLEPGHGGAHQPDEFIPIPCYIEGIKLLATMILEVDQILD